MYMARGLGYQAILTAVLVAWAGCGGCTRSGPRPFEQMTYPELGQIQMPQVRRVVLSNGIRLYLVEDHELPVVSCSAMIRTGSVYEPADKVGLADITAEVMRTGGTANMTGDQIDQVLEQMAASVEISMGRTAGYASVWSLREDFDQVLSILADVLRKPVFDQDKIDLAKMQHRSAIARRNDDPGEIASREFAKLVYGSDSVYARHTEYYTIDRITRDDLIEFHRRYFGPNNLWMAVWGDFDTQQMIEVVDKAFSGWPAVADEISAPPPVEYRYRSSVNLVIKQDINQSNIVMGHLGGKMDDPDYFALVVMNRILGEGFTSRLFRNVRSRQGLAYSVFGRYGCGFDYPGMFMVGCQTGSDNTVHAIRAMQEEVRRICRAEVTDQELATAKESFLNAFIFNYASKASIVRRMMEFEYYGYPADFLDRIRRNVEKVAKSQILEAARSHLDPERLQILVVGRPQDFDQDLEVLGPVNHIDISIASTTSPKD